MRQRKRRLGIGRIVRVVYKSLRNHWMHYRLGQRGIQVGYHVTFQGRSQIIGHNLRIGAYSRMVTSYLDARGELDIGEKCILMNATIFTATHDLHSPIYDTVYKPVVIEDYVIVFPSAIILPGVRIGRGGVIGAGAVVYRDVPPMSIVSGNPAQVISTRQCVHDHISLPVMVGHYTIPELLGKVFRRKSPQ